MRKLSARRVTVAAVLALATSLIPASAIDAASALAGAPPQLTGSSEQLGANAGELFNSHAYTPAEIDAQLGALARTGTTLVRSDALWEEAEPQPPIGPVHRYDWSFDDLIAGSLAAHGLRWLPIIDYSAPWAKADTTQNHSPTSSAADYASYAAALAARYGPGGLFWIEHPQLLPLAVQAYEIWNEPDNPVFWYPSPNPAAYADLYTRAQAAIKFAQPGAQVIIGGLTRPGWFLSALLAADPGLAQQIDGVAIHPYAPTPDGVLLRVREARLAMRADGLTSVPLYVTEFGWTTHAPARDFAAVDERPAYIAQTLSQLGHTDCGVAATLLYTWATTERNPADPEDWFGISPPGAGGSADTSAFSSGLSAASQPEPTLALCSGSGSLAHLGIAQSSRPRARSSRHRSARHRHRDRRHRRRRAR